MENRKKLIVLYNGKGYGVEVVDIKGRLIKAFDQFADLEDFFEWKYSLPKGRYSLELEVTL